MTSFYGTLALGMVIGAGLAHFTCGLLDLVKRKDNHPDALAGLEEWEPLSLDPDQRRSGEVGQIIIPRVDT